MLTRTLDRRTYTRLARPRWGHCVGLPVAARRAHRIHLLFAPRGFQPLL